MQLSARNDASTQSWLMNLMREAGIATDEDFFGLCFGYSICSIEAMLSGDEDYVNNIKLLFHADDPELKDYGKFSLPKLQQAIATRKESLANFTGEISDRAIIESELKKYGMMENFLQQFFTNLYTHQFPIRNSATANLTTLQNARISSNVTASDALKEKGGLKSLKPFSGVYKKDSLKKYFSTLKDAAQRPPKLPHPFALLLEGSEHSININYDANLDRWTLLDANQQPMTTENLDEVVDYCIKGFFEKDRAMFVTHVQATGDSEVIVNQKLQNWRTDSNFLYVHQLEEELVMHQNTAKENWLHLAAEIGELDVMQKICADWPECINEQTTSGATPLIYALLWQENAAVDLLIKNQADLRLGHYNDASPFFIAGYTGNNAILNTLFSNQQFFGKLKAPLDSARFITGSYYRTSKIDVLALEKSIYNAAAGGHIETLEKYLQNETNLGKLHPTSGMAPIHIAASNNQVAVINLLLDKGCDIDLIDVNQRTPLMHAFINKNFQLAETLIENGANIHVKDKHGNAVLHYAAKFGTPSIASRLLNALANANDRNDANQSVLMFAAEVRQVEVFQILLAAGADIFSKNINGASVFDVIDQQLYSDKLSQEEKDKSVKMLQMLYPILAKADPEKIKINRRIMLRIAQSIISAHYTNQELVNAAIFAGAKPNSTEFRILLSNANLHNEIDLIPLIEFNGQIAPEIQPSFETIVMKFIEQNNVLGLQKLINNGLDVKTLEKNGRFLIAHAIKNAKSGSNDLEMFKILVNAGARMNYEISSVSLLEYAKYCGNVSIEAQNYLKEAATPLPRRPMFRSIKPKTKQENKQDEVISNPNKTGGMI